VKLDTGVHVVLETKGHDDLEQVKTQAAERWVRAVNAEGSFGEWRYAISHAMNEIPELLDEVSGVIAGA
jgi:type III restriction enzyme